MNFTKFFSIAAVVTAGLSLQLAQAANWTYSSATATAGCAGGIDSTGLAADFSITPVVNKAAGVSQTLKMAFVMDSTTARTSTTAKADIIFVERTGAVKYYKSSDQTTTTIGTVPNVGTATEDGLIGVAVERVFKNRVYVSYSFTDGSTVNTAIHGTFRIARYNMDPTTHMMDMTSAKVLLEAPSFRNRWHTAGGLTFDNAGNLYWAVGDNETAFSGPGNTHDLRGGINRIHPEENGTYTIPSGNLWEVVADSFTRAGRTALAAQYRDTSKVYREIYVKGTRNAYTLAVNPYTQRIVYSQCGADNQGSTRTSETQNFTNKPIFAGWPFWIGTDSVTPTQTTMASQYGKNTTAGPGGVNGEPATQALYQSNWPLVNGNTAAARSNPITHWTVPTNGTNFGMDTLPWLTPSRVTYVHGSTGGSCAMGSLIYNYDGRIANPNKLPPSFDNVWLGGDYAGLNLRGIKIDDAGNLLGAFGNNKIFTALQTTANAGTIKALTDVQQGPDGALYVVNYQCSNGTTAGAAADNCTGIARIEYKGTCQDPNFTPLNHTVVSIAQKIFRGDVNWLQVGPTSFSVTALGGHEAQIIDSKGRVISSMRGVDQQTYSFPTLSGKGIYYLQVKTNEGTAIRAFSHI